MPDHICSLCGSLKPIHWRTPQKVEAPIHLFTQAVTHKNPPSQELNDGFEGLSERFAKEATHPIESEPSLLTKALRAEVRKGHIVVETTEEEAIAHFPDGSEIKFPLETFN